MALKDKTCIVSSPTFIKRAKNVKRRHGRCSSHFLSFFLEREQLLSKFPSNPTVGIRRDKKESCFTRRGQRVGTGLLEF